MIKIKQKAALNFEKFLSFSILLKYLNSEEKVYCHLLRFLSHFQEPLARRKYEKPARPLAIFAVEKSNLFSSLSHFHFIHVCNTFLSFSRFFTTRKIRKYARSFYIIISMQPPLSFPLFHSRLFHFLVFASLALIN